MGSVVVNIIRNPFNPTDREICTVDHSYAITLKGYVCQALHGTEGEFAVSINGQIVPPEEWSKTSVAPGSYIVVVPILRDGGGDSNPLAVITSVALMAWAGGLASGGVFGFAGGTFGAQMAAAAIAMVGGMIINRFFPPPKPEMHFDNVTSNPSYTWGRLQSLQTQGNPLGVTYGTVKSAGQIIAQHVTSDGDKQYLNILLLAGEGPLDSITDITINDNPVTNYENVQVDIRIGTNDQDVIPNFNDTYADQQLGFELTENWSTQQTESGSANGLEITIELPGGLYYANDNGGLDTAWIELEAQFRPVGANAWYDWTFDGHISGAQNNALRKVYRVDNLPEAKYEVRVRCAAKSGTGTRYGTRVYWTQLSSIIYDDFCYPGKALIGIRALATDQLSGGLPSITFKKTRSAIWAYNPRIGQYEAKPAQNPAWVCYDVIHRCRRLKNIHTGISEFTVFGIPASRIDYDKFQSWADFCTEKGLEFHFDFDTASDMWDALKKPSAIGRGRVYLQGTSYTCVFDAPSQPVQMFTMSNIKADSFKEYFLGLKDRANAVEITYVDRERDYQRTAITVYADDYNETDSMLNTTQITLDGCTSIEEAYRHGKYLLKVNRYLQRTVDFEADVDSIACQVGDVVLIQHDVPQWGQESGRVIDATASTVTLDKYITLHPGISYGLLVRTANDVIIERTVQAVVSETTTNVLNVTTPYGTMPAKGDIYSFGEFTKIAKPFSIIDITRGQDQRRKISAIEYVEAVYTEATDIPVIDYSSLEPVVEISGLSVSQETYRQKDGTIVSVLHASWQLPRWKYANRFIVFYSVDNGLSWIKWGETNQFKAVINVKSMETYLVKVCTLNDLGSVSQGVISVPIYITGKDNPPPDVETLYAEKTAGGFWRFTFTLSNPPVDLAGYRFKYNIGSSTFWYNAIALNDGLVLSSPFETNSLQGGIFTVLVKAVDNSGNESANAASVIIGLGDEIVNNVIFKQDFQAGGFTGTKINCTVNSGILVANDTGGAMYPADDNAPIYVADNALFYDEQWAAMTYEDTFTPDGDGTLMFALDADGNSQIFYRQRYPYPIYGSDSDLMFPDDKKLMYQVAPYVAYSGKVQTNGNSIHDVRLVIGAGKTHGIVRGFAAIVDVEDEYEVLNDISVPATGMRLPITKKYRSIKNVNITIQDNGGATALTFRLADKDVSGPFITLYDKNNSAVSGVIDAQIQGIKG